MDNRQRIVITGIGPISSVGIGREKFWEGILNKKINIELEECHLDGELWDKFYYHKVKDFDISKFGIEKSKLQDIRDWKEGEEVVDFNYLIAAVKLALDDSGLDYNNEDNGIGLVLAHENLGLTPFASNVSNGAYEILINKSQKGITKKEFFAKLYQSFLKSFYDMQAFPNLFNIARIFNIKNYSLFINNACASGLYALESASQIIRSNQAKKVVVAVSDYPDIYKYLWFRDLGIYSKDGVIKPFDKDSNGLVFGDGGVALVLEDFRSAVKREVDIYAEYLGGGFSLEGYKITVPGIGSSSYQQAMLNAFAQSQVDKEEIDLLCSHGVASKPIDYYESKAITDIFGKNPKSPLISTFKPYVGHNLGGSALLETAILLLSLKNNIILPTLNTEKVDSRFNISLVKEKKEVKFKTAMKICCAFAGFNSAAVFKKV